MLRQAAARLGARALGTGPRRARAAARAAVDGVEDQADHLRARRRTVCVSVGQAVEQVEAAEDADDADDPRQRRRGTCARASGSRRRSTSIAAQTAMKAASVPALASAAIAVSGIRPAKTDVTIAVKMVIRTGVPRLDTRARLAGSKPVAGTGEEDPALAVEEGEDHRRQARSPPTRRGSRAAQRLADLAQDQRQRLGAVGEAGVGDARRSRPRRPPCR